MVALLIIMSQDIGKKTDRSIAMTNDNVQQMQPLASDYAGVRQYIGARYVPLFADPAEWSNTRGYEPLTIVIHNGNSYTSTQFVPTGVDITDTEYWKLTGNYNAQIEQYRQEVENYRKETDGVSNQLNDIKTDITDVEGDVTRIDAELKQEVIDRTNEDNALVEKINNDIAAVNERINNPEKNIMVVFGDSFNVGNYTATPLWHSLVASKLNVNVKNYAEDGARWSYFTNGVGRSLINQINEYIQDTSYNKSLVKYVVVYMGCNDAAEWNSAAELSNAVNASYDLLNSTFPNSEIVVANTGRSIEQYGVNTQEIKRENFIGNMLTRQNGNYAIKSYAAQNIIKFTLNAYNTENWHPTELGNIGIANFFIQVLTGGQYVYPTYLTGHEQDGVSLGTNITDYCDKIQNMRVYISSRGTLNITGSATANGITLFNIPVYGISSNSLCYDDSGNIAGRLSYDGSTGNCYITGANGTVNVSLNANLYGFGY